MSRIKLPPEELKRRELERSRKANEKVKAQRLIDRANGIKPVKQILSDERKEVMRLYSQRKRAEQGYKKRSKKTPEELKEAKRISMLKYSRKKNNIKPENYRERKPKSSPLPKPIKKMQQPLKQTPPAAVSTYHKPDHFKQPAKMKITNNSTEGKIPVVIKPGFTVYINPGQDAEQVRQRYLNR